MKNLYTILLLTIAFIASISIHAQSAGKKITYKITVLKSNGDPQPGILLKIIGNSEEYTGNEQGVITFDYEWKQNTTRTASLYFPNEKFKSVYSFILQEDETSKTIYLDRPEDITAYKQQNSAFKIEGNIKRTNNRPIAGALIDIQGTGRKATSDKNGYFSIEADYNHPIIIRADGMENKTMNIKQFIQHPDEPLNIYMYPRNASQLYSIAEKMPEYPGGMKAFMNYLKYNLKYPDWAKKAGKEGVVIVQFIVERDGEITSPTIVRPLEASMDSAAITAIRKMPKWVPAMEQGRVVRCKYSVPVQFKIEKPKPKPQPQKEQVKLSSLADSIAAQSEPNDSLNTLPIDSIHVSSDSIHIKMEQGTAILTKDSLTVSVNDTLSITSDKLKEFGKILTQEPKDSLNNEMKALPEKEKAVSEKKDKRNTRVSRKSKRQKATQADE
ncbi:TonB family protein [uncultured Bacteroides sp.]|uniref:TonB family protein n=1 Tax=uncultured Bacteroides sp. TaxID=162156 RepID=UPI0026339490|nr:TonB family protein [uncultured Bacteroides sp.]